MHPLRRGHRMQHSLPPPYRLEPPRQQEDRPPMPPAMPVYRTPIPSYRDYDYDLAYASSSVKDPITLPSRASALTRRCTVLATNIAQLTAVVEPLKSMNPENVSDEDIRDISVEAGNAWDAMKALQVQMWEVWGILGELERRREKKKEKEKEREKESEKEKEKEGMRKKRKEKRDRLWEYEEWEYGTGTY